MVIVFMLIYAVIVGVVAKLLMPSDAPAGLLSSIVVGIVGTYVGGFLNWLLGSGSQPFETSGIIMGIIGSVIALAIWRWYNLQFVVGINGTVTRWLPQMGPRSFWTGKKKW